MEQKKTKKVQPRVRNWCFTDFKELDFKYWENLYNTYPDLIRYICVGREVCPKTGKEHIQGWVQFSKQFRMSRVKSLFMNKEIHLEVCYGNAKTNERYCKKDGNFKTYGKFMVQGQRTDLEIVCKRIKDGESLDKIALDHSDTWIKYHGGFKDLKQRVDRNKRKAFRKVETTMITGPTGTGKTRHVMDKHPECYKICGSELNWFDGYDGEDVLLIDEYNNDVNITRMLNLLDGYRLRLPVKGSFVYANWTKVYITTNLNPDELHQQARSVHRAALRRRITKWIYKDYDRFDLGE